MADEDEELLQRATALAGDSPEPEKYVEQWPKVIGNSLKDPSFCILLGCTVVPSLGTLSARLPSGTAKTHGVDANGGHDASPETWPQSFQKSVIKANAFNPVGTTIYIYIYMYMYIDMDTMA